MKQIILTTALIVAAIFCAAWMLAKPARSQEAAKAPSEYTLKVTPADIVLLGQAIDELPAKIGRPLAQRLITQVQAQDADFAKKNIPLDKTPQKR